MRTSLNLVGIISDLVLWALLLAAIGGCVLAYQKYELHKHHRRHRDLVLYFNQVDELTEGSPVDLMGADIGSVTKVNPHGDLVAVHIKTDVDAPAIPSGSHVTVEFNGLAGAKSLEILPGQQSRLQAQTENGALSQGALNAPYVVDEPIRLKQVFDAMNVVALSMEDAANGVSDILGESVNNRETTMTIMSYNRILTNWTGEIEKLSKAVTPVLVSLDNQSHSLTRTFTNIANGTAKWQRKTGSSGLRRQIAHAHQAPEQWQVQMAQLQKTSDTYTTGQLSGRVVAVHQQIQNSHAQQSLQKWSTFNQFLAQAAAGLQKAQTFFQHPDQIKQRIDALVPKAHELNVKTQKLPKLIR